MPTCFRKGLALLALAGTCALASATPYIATLSGAAEVVPNDSPGTGVAVVTFDIDAHSLSINAAFAGLEGATTAVHIHCCTDLPGSGGAGVATMTPTFDGFPGGVMAGAYSHLFNTSLASFWNASFITANGGTTAGAEAALLAGLNAGTAYFNIHSTEYPGGEIRGFLAPPVPEPATVGMLLAGVPIVLWVGRRRAKTV